MDCKLLPAIASFLLVTGHVFCVKYTPDWPSLDSRPLPQWYDEAKIGVFMHWGPYTVPGVQGAWFWYQWIRNDPNNKGDQEVVEYMKNHYSPDFKYQEFGPMFRAEFFNATKFEEIVASSGAKYFVFTSKHHDGFTNWPSDRSFGWNSVDIGQKRDIVGELAAAFQAKERVKFGLYHSLYEWFNPMYIEDKLENFTKQSYIENKMMPELLHLINTYKPQVLWSDGDWESTTEYWKSLEFLAWLYSESPVKDSVVTNDRWGLGTSCRHGDFFTCTDRYNPGVLQPHKWENAMTIDRISWAHRRNIELQDILSMEELMEILAKTVSCGGNLLMNVGPNSQGTIEPIFEERLREMGTWLSINGEAIYGTVPWIFQNDTTNAKVWYTSKACDKAGVVVYAILLEWPTNDQVKVSSPLPGPRTSVTILGSPANITWEALEKGMRIAMPSKEIIASNHAWVIKITHLENAGNQIW